MTKFIIKTTLIIFVFLLLLCTQLKQNSSREEETNKEISTTKITFEENLSKGCILLQLDCSLSNLYKRNLKIL